MACMSSLGFFSLATTLNFRKFPTIFGCLLVYFIVFFVILSGYYSYKLPWVYYSYNPVQMKCLEGSFLCGWSFNSTRYLTPTVCLNSITLFPDEQQINHLKRLNKPKNRRAERPARVIYRNITIANEQLRPVRVFHRPGKNAPYIVELYVVTDEKFVSSFSHDIAQVVTRVNSIFKAANSLFARFNVQFVIVGLEIWEKNRVNLEAEEHFLRTLASFKRAEVNTRHDCLLALLGDNDQTTTRGRANNQVMCKYSSCVSFVRDSQYMEVNETARTVAHELGHTFGLRHDTEDCECQGCIMATGVEFGTATMEWSPCSVRDMPNFLHYGMGACLRDAPVQSHSSLLLRQSRMVEVNGPSIIHTYTAINTRRGTPELFQSTPSSLMMSLCGNGKIDPGEECDCGSVETCPKEVQACCDVKTCRFRNGAECASGPCCDVQMVYGDPSTATCKFKQSGSVCRAAGNSCDLPEYCDGKSEWCPTDVFKTDGEFCYTKEGYRSHCIRGGCNAPDEWCRVLWGPTGTAAGPGCVGYNLIRDPTSQAIDEVANCGRLRPRADERWREIDQWPSKPCYDWPDAECGRLWCIHQNEKAMLLGWQERQHRVDPRSQRTCVALVYDPLDPLQHAEITPETGFPGPGWGDAASVTQDAGMTPDGTPCQRGMCYNGSCIRREELPFRKECDCNFNGVCNNLGHCHCNSGYAPPDCVKKGNGGSIDSGPPPPSWYEYGFIFAICFIIFILCPAFLLCMYCMLCRCHKRRLVFPKSEPIPPPLDHVEPFDRAAFFRSLCQCCRRCRPYFNNDPPIIVAFGPPDPKNALKNGHVFTTNGKSPMQNGRSVKTFEPKMNGSAASAVAYPMAAKEHNRYSPNVFRRELANEFNKDSKKPNYLRDLEAAWETAEQETGFSKNSPLGSSASGSGTGVRVEISSPRLENTTFKGETRSLASAARIQQQQRAARSRRPPEISSPRIGPHRHPIYPSNGPTKPDISAPTLQASTYKYGLMELPEAYSTLKNPKRNKKPRSDTGYSTLQPKR